MFLLCVTLIAHAQLLSEKEQQSLLYMFEEEKLAQDVYTDMSAKWNQNPFNNIITSEQSHKDTVGMMLIQNGISQPDNSIGIFNNSELQNLYIELKTQGSISYNEALKVGATIEDRDIFDLNNYKLNTQNPQLIALYDWLICASKNHMRAFTKKLNMSGGGNYTPKYITQEEYQAIISGTNGACTLNLSVNNSQKTKLPIVSQTLVKNNFKVLLKGKSSVDFYSIDGKQIEKIMVYDQENIDISRYPAGIYFLYITNQETSHKIKIFKQ